MGTPLIEILLVDHHPGDIRLVMEVFREMKLANPVNIVQDTSHITDYLYQCGEYSCATRPDLILMEPFLPDRRGQELLDTVKTCARVLDIPVILVLESEAEWDQMQHQGFNFHSYVTRPLHIPALIKVITAIENFWLMIGQ